MSLCHMRGEFCIINNWGDASLNVLLRDSHRNTAGKDLHIGYLYCEGG